MNKKEKDEFFANNDKLFGFIIGIVFSAFVSFLLDIVYT